LVRQEKGDLDLWQNKTNLAGGLFRPNFTFVQHPGRERGPDGGFDAAGTKRSGLSFPIGTGNSAAGNVSRGAGDGPFAVTPGRIICGRGIQQARALLVYSLGGTGEKTSLGGPHKRNRKNAKSEIIGAPWLGSGRGRPGLLGEFHRRGLVGGHSGEPGPPGGFIQKKPPPLQGALPLGDHLSRVLPTLMNCPREKPKPASGRKNPGGVWQGRGKTFAALGGRAIPAEALWRLGNP